MLNLTIIILDIITRSTLTMEVVYEGKLPYFIGNIIDHHFNQEHPDSPTNSLQEENVKPKIVM